MTRLRTVLSLTALVVTLSGCGNRSDSDGTGGAWTPPIAADTDFLLFPNSHASLGVGDYDVLIRNSSLPSNPTAWTLTVRYSDGSVQTFSGTWTGNPETDTQTIELTRPGGVQLTLDSGGATADLTLRVAGTGSDIAVSSNTVNPGIDLPRYQIDSVNYADAYYDAIDPDDDRITLAAFKTTNGFGTNCAPNGVDQFEVRFRDVLDLGYGRHMCMRRDGSGDIAVWVENFQVSAAPGQNYGPLNLAAVINDDRQWHVGTNAIEYSAGPGGGARFVKFYTFNPDGTRRQLVDLDGRGAKAMPVPCISCHGGHALPLTAQGLFPAIRTSPRGDTLARMQPFNVDTLDFATTAPYRRTDLEASLKAMNQIVLCSYPLVGASAGTEDDCRPAAANLEWGGTAAAMIKSWYGGNGMPNAVQSDTFVPTEWQDGETDDSIFPSVAVPTGATNLYQSVVAPSCRVCHLLRGNQNEHAINFASYGKFADPDPAHTAFPPAFGNANSYNLSIKHHVFDKGNMPLALLKFDHFWETDAPDILAPFIVGATDGSGNAWLPTRPVAKPGPNRTVVTGVPTRLSAAESTNATSYQWSITSVNAANATLTNATSIRPTFTANVDDVYTVQLVVNNGSAASAPATLTIGAVATLTDGAGLVSISDPADIRFSHVRTILQDNTAYFCTSCHTHLDPGGPPVYYTDYDRDGDSNVDAADLHQFYLDIRARINFSDIASSRLLFRPSGHHHPGALVVNFDTSVTPGSAGRGAYDVFLNWILHGAPE